ncbi:predicted protein [Naegleria gruberi]|uniref:Predicted protein n=1 Tax=Naegleria gruberi TaxID=5762 RepID=D2VTT0_NAEGR|nr:uncharacterized protein NAEGRDRAFT_72413 [Naegleria gruberi]EFC39706.1 predicted protein [Naegleria gruberi]|eukprot:XP_002672450.1 predicted protein [Naegleria gruberi strain NEG-M]
MSEIVGHYIMSMMLPLGVFQSLDCFPISISRQVGNYIMGIMLGLIALLSLNRGFLLVNFGIKDEIIVMVGMSISILLALYGWFVSNRSTAIYKSKNLIYCIVAMSIADMILTKHLLDSVNFTPFTNIDLFHIAFSVAIFFLSNVSSGVSF